MAGAYEMQLIGQFLFMCGNFIGRSEATAQGHANVFQQTALDAALSDYFGSTGERYFMVEFKAENGDESAKRDGVRGYMRERLALAHGTPYQGRRTYADLSNRCHLFGEADLRTGSVPDCTFVPYLDTVNLTANAHAASRITFADIDGFIRDGMYGNSPALQLGLPLDEFTDYLNFAIGTYPKKASKTEDTLMYVFVAKDGEVRWKCELQLENVFPMIRVPGKTLPKTTGTKKVSGNSLTKT